MSDYIEVPDSLVHEMLAALMAWFPKDSDSLADVPTKLIDAFIELVREAGGCDHSVGICMCREEDVVTELLLVKDGRATCRKCGGDTYIWDECLYERNRLEYEREGYDAPESCGNIKCPGCDGRGTVRLSEDEIKVLAALPPNPGFDHRGP